MMLPRRSVYMLVIGALIIAAMDVVLWLHEINAVDACTIEVGDRAYCEVTVGQQLRSQRILASFGSAIALLYVAAPKNRQR
jgi:hypothetical protein